MVFRNASGYQWVEEADPVLLNCRPISKEAAQVLLTSLTVNVP